MKLRIFILVIICCLPKLHYGQSYYFRHYQVENGLSNNATICSLQDKKGFLWFGTKDGLDRFDGYTFKVFRKSTAEPGSIGSNFIHSLFEDAAGVLWVGTENGLYQYDAVTERFTFVEASGNLPIRDIITDAKGNLWIIAGFTLMRYNPATKATESYPVATHFEATSLCTAGNTVWASTTTGFLMQYDYSRNSFNRFDMFQHSATPVSRWVERVYASSNNKILVGTSNQGAKVFDIATNTYKDILTFNNSNIEIFVRNFIQTSPDECWIGTESGIYIYNLSSGSTINLQKKYNDPYSISDNAVYCFVKDKEGSIWAGTYFGGINYFPRQQTAFTKHFPRPGENSISGNVVREIHEDGSGHLWIGTEDAGLNKFDTGINWFTHFKPALNKKSIASTNIHGLLVDGDEVWIGTFENGLDVMNINTGEVIRHYASDTGRYSLKSNFIYCIAKTGNDEIVLGTTQGAYRFNRSSNNFSLLPGMPLNNWYTCILKDQQGIIWASTYGNGVNFYDTKTGKSGNFRYNGVDKNGITSDRVNSIFEDSRHNLWMATEGGLCLYNRQQNNFKRFTTQDGFPSNFFLNILEDASKNLWISTSKGLVCFNPANGHKNIYTRVNGLLSDQFNFNAAYKDQSGRMYFGSVKGMISFHPDSFSKKAFIPPVYITGFQVFNKELVIAEKGSPLTKSITNTQQLTLDHNQSTFSIDFAALSYTAPEMSEYAYKMEGLDKDWIYLKTNRKVYFTELAPGTYTFKVKAANSSGIWNNTETSLSIQILPPWWLSAWAIAGYILASIIIMAWLIRSYHKRAEEKNRRKMELMENAKEKEILQAKIEFFTNVAHEIKTPLTLIKGPLEKVIRNTIDVMVIKDSLKIMERNTNRLIDLSNQLLDFRQTEIKGFTLNSVKTDITELLEETYLNFKPLAEQKELLFQLHLSAPRLWAYVDMDAFNKILTNLFSNAVKYAHKKVQVHLLPVEKGDTSFTIEIKNDGFLIPYEMKDKIFEPFFRLKETAKQKGTGIGLALSRSLVQLHNGTLEIKPAKQNMNVFCLTMPLMQEAAKANQ